MRVILNRDSKRAPETATFAMDFRRDLNGDELLEGTPTVAEHGTDALTISGVDINDEALTIDGRAVAIGEAVVFTVAGGVAGSSYIVRVTATTDEGQTLWRKFRLKVL